MLNTEFKNWDKETQQQMTKLWTQVFAVGMEQNLGILSPVVWLNDNFELIYKEKETEQDVWMECFDELGIKYQLKEQKDKK